MATRKKLASSKRLKKYTKPLVILFALVVIIVVLEATNTTHFFHSAKSVSGNIPATNTSQDEKPTPKSTNKGGSSSTTNTSTPSDKTPGSPPPNPGNSTLTLQAPFGAFVSNHSPNLNGAPAPSKEQSVCNTTPGASCRMTFANGDGVVKTLPAQTADNDGLVYWTWDVKDAGFSAGEWKISVTSTLNGQTKSTSDQLNLNVKP